MTPGQLGEIVLLQNELSSIYVKADSIGRLLEVARERFAAQSMRQVCAYLNCIDDELNWVIKTAKEPANGCPKTPPDPLL